MPEPRGRPPRLVLLVARDDPVNGTALAEIRPELLLTAFDVVADDRVRRIEDGHGGPVILVEGDNRRFGEISLEFEQVAHIGAAPAVDRLIVVADYEQVAVLLHQEPEQLILHAVRVLVFVDHDVVEALLVRGENTRMFAPQLQRHQQEVVEIEAVRRPQRRLIPLEHVRKMLPVLLLRCRDLLFRLRPRFPERGARVFVEADGRLEQRRAECFAAVRVFEHAPQQNAPVAFRRDCECAPVADLVGVLAQHPHAEGVKGRDRDPRRPFLPDHLCDAFAHLVRRLVRERYGEDGRRRAAARCEQVRDALRDNARLAATRACQHEYRPFRLQHGFPLTRIQPVKMCGIVGHERVFRKL